tara:strand:- start:16651 stop:18861 length:2211 start_codon:yes stop_codon:yes gene_type:complete
MFRVHYSSDSLAESRGRFDIVDTLHRTWNIMKQQMVLRKSYGLYHIGEDETHPIRHWSPKEVFNPPEDIGWYDQFEGPEGVRAHHPPFGHDFKTGRLLHRTRNGVTEPESSHPLDYMMGHMHSVIRSHLIKEGINPDARNPGFGEEHNIPIWNMDLVKQLFQGAIDNHNKTGQKLPDVNSVLWRLNTSGPFDGNSVRSQRQVGTEDGRPTNYSANMGNLHDLEGADKGMFIDGGVHPMYDSTAELYESLRNMYREQLGVELPPKDRFHYLGGSKVRLDNMTFGRVKALSGPEAKKHFGEDGSGMIPGHKSGKVIENYHPLDVAQFAPKALFATPTRKMGGKKRAQVENSAEIASRTNEIMQELRNIGVEIKPEDIEKYRQYASMPISQFLIGGTGHQVNDNSRAPAILRGVAASLGVDMDSPMYKRVRDSIATRKGPSKNKGLNRSRDLYAIPWMHSLNLVASGQVESQQDAWAQALDNFRNADYDHKDHAYDEANHDAYLQFANAFRNTDDHRGQRSQVTGKLPEAHKDHPHHAIHSSVPDHWAGHVHGIPQGVSPTADQAHEVTRNMLDNNADSPELHRQAMGDAAAPTRMEEIEAARAQLTNLTPGVSRASANLPQPSFQDFEGTQRVSRQQRLDDGSIITSEERTVSDLLKTMERIQFKEASQDTVVKSLAQYRSRITKADDVSVVAKSLGISVMDVHGIYHSHGDWHRVANDWNVGPEIVKAVKVTFGGGV